MRRQRPFQLIGLFLALQLALLVVSESCLLSFRHHSWRLREMRVLLEEATEESTDVLLLGSSRVMAAVQPAVVASTFEALRPGETLVARNLGLEKGDWELVYLLLKRHLRVAGAPQTLVCEIGQIDITRDRHRLLRNIASPRDLPTLFGDWKLRESIELSLAVLGRGSMDLVLSCIPWDTDRAAIQRDAGWHLYDGTDGIVWALSKQRTAAQVLRDRSQARYDAGDPHTRFLHKYLPRVRALCDEHGIELKLLHVPQFLEGRLSPSQRAFFAAHGDVIEPYYPELYEPACYKEERHLNELGSRRFSAQVGRALAGAPLPSLDDWLARQE